MMVPTRRDDTMDSYCKSHPKEAECSKPVSENATIIAVCVVVPVVIIACILGWFLWRNYRKDKKEQMEHDPDFDETGDGTALPDFHHYETNDNPFNNDSLLGELLERKPAVPYMHEKFQHSSTSVGTSDPLESFLPMAHATELKLSLNEYVRQFPDNYGYMNRSSYMQPGMRQSSLLAQFVHLNNSLSNLSNPNHLHLNTNLHQRTVSSGHASEIMSLDQHLKHAVMVNSQSVDNFAEQEEQSDEEGPFADSTDSKHLDDANHVDDDDDDDASNFTFELLNLKKSPNPNLVARFPAELPTVKKDKPRKLPRISQFNLMSNDSDDEGEHTITAEQAEELERMKLVYRVYFDKDKPQQFEADPLNPLPQMINLELSANTDYSKRMTVASLLYDGGNHPYRTYQLPPMEQAATMQSYLEQPMSQHSNADYNQTLPTLQNIPNALDIRQLTLQTYTNYGPEQRGKRPQMGAAVRGEFDPLEHLPSQETLETPLATQLARSSVAMMNPTGITRKKTFKPAGAHHTQGRFNANDNENDLVPQAGDELRHMMNSNF